MEDCLKGFFFFFFLLSPQYKQLWDFLSVLVDWEKKFIFKIMQQVPYKSLLSTFNKLQNHGCEIFCALSLLQAVPHISC